MRRHATVLSAVAFLSLCGSGVDSVHADATQNFIQVAFIPEEGWLGHLAGYDTDHDGHEELLVPGITKTSLYEHTGNNQYELVLELSDRLCWAAGDIDQDGLSDIVVQGYDSLEVFESQAPDSHPSHCVWQWAILNPASRALTWITDLDQDGKREMLISHYGNFICIYENAADNAYAEVFHDTLPQAASEMTTGDFDCDGKTEFVTSDIEGSIFAFENVTVGLDSFVITWTDSLPIGMAYAVAAGNDMDQDSKPEFVIGGGRIVGGGRKFIYTVFESTGDDVYEPVWSHSSLSGGLFDYHHVACGDVDADSIDEMVFGLDGYGIALYKCNGPDSYERIWQWYTGQYICDILIYDLNKNGYGEIVVCAENGTWIFEMELPGIEEHEPQLPVTDARLMQNVPNPFSRTTTIRYSLPPRGGDAETRGEGDLSTYPFDSRGSLRTTRLSSSKSKGQRMNLSVYDLSGRLVRTLVDAFEQAGLKNVVWDGKDDRGELVGSGVYFYRLVAGNLTATEKLVVLR